MLYKRLDSGKLQWPQMTEAWAVVVREVAKFIPVKMRIQHIEHAYECKHCKKNAQQKAQIKREKHHNLEIREALQVQLF